MTAPRDMTVNDLFARYLDSQIDAARQGLGYPEDLGGVVPHDTTPVQPIDPKLAWGDATAALVGSEMKGATPPDWPSLVNQQEPAVALAFALGNYPQQVRHIQALLTGSPVALRETTTVGALRPDLIEWATARTDEAERLLAAGVLRLARQYDAAADLLALPVGEGLQAAHANEQAALLWHKGNHTAALLLWRSLPESAPVLFNLGMASLFTGDVAEAKASLEKAAKALPEQSAWHHLAGLYLAMASAQG